MKKCINLPVNQSIHQYAHDPLHSIQPAPQEGRKALCGQNFYEPSALDFWRGFPLYSLHEYNYLRCVPALVSLSRLCSSHHTSPNPARSPTHHEHHPPPVLESSYIPTPPHPHTAHREKYGAEGRFPDLPAKVCEPLLEAARQQRQHQQRPSLWCRYLENRRQKLMRLLL